MSSTDQDVGVRRRSSPSPPSASLHARPHLPDLDPFDADDIPLPSPPYKRNPSNPHLAFGFFPEESPAYRSNSDLDLPTEFSRMADEKHEEHERYDSDTDNDEQSKPRTKTARFQVDVISPLATEHPHFPRTDTYDSDTRSVSSSLADTDDEDYDWSGEEDLVQEEANFEENMGVAKTQRWGFRRYIAVIFGSLLGSAILSGVLITPPLLVHFFWYKPHPDSHREYVKDNLEAWFFWAAANLTISWYLALAIDVAPIAVRFLISAFWGHVSETVKTRTELYNSVKDTLKPLLYAASAWASWVIIFENIYQLYDIDDTSKSRAHYTVRFYQVVEFTFFFAFVICAQQMLSHAIAFSFHRTAYKERLEQLKEALEVIEHLRTYRPKKSHIKSSSQGFGSRSFNALNFASTFGYNSRPGTPTQSHPSSRPATPSSQPQSRSGSPSRGDSADELGMRTGHETDNEDHSPILVRRRSKGKGKSKAHSVAGWFSHDNSPETESEPVTPQRHPQDSGSPSYQYPPAHHDRNASASGSGNGNGGGSALGTVARGLKTAVLHDARNIEGRDAAGLGGLAWGVSSSREAKRLARSIYAAFRAPTRTYLIWSDFYPAYATYEEADARERAEARAKAAFRIFDADNNGDLNRGEIKATLVRVYRERRSLSRSMRDVSQALQTLNQMLFFFAMVVLLFISLSVFDVNVGSSLTSLYSLGIGLSFIFKNSASNAFDAIMFLFVTHPFDTGDRCFVDDENLVVKKMGLFATVFQRADGTESYYFNSQLFEKFIINARRSDKTAEGLTLQVDWRTPWDKLDKLASCLNHWLEREPNRWFEPTTSVTPQHIDYMRTMEVTIGIGHNSNWQDWDLRLDRRTTFNAAVNYYTRSLGITSYEPTIPVAYTDPDDPQQITAYPGDEDMYEVDDESEALSHEQLQKDPEELLRDEKEAAPPEPKEMHRPALLGFLPPPDKPMPGVRVRKPKSRKAMLRTVVADG